MDTNHGHKPEYIEGTSTPIEYTKSGWPIFAIGSDMAYISIDDFGNTSLLMIMRGIEPYKGHYALPGGHTDPTETTLEGAIRETEEEVNISLNKDVTSLSHVNSTPGRDPNKPTMASIHYHLTDKPQKPQPGDDAAEASHVRLNETFNRPLAFGVRDDLANLYNNLAERAYYNLGFFIKVLDGSSNEAIARSVKEIFDITNDPKYDIITLEKIVDNVKAYRSGFNIWE